MTTGNPPQKKYKYHFFLSYEPEENEYARNLYQLLNVKKFSVWYNEEHQSLIGRNDVSAIRKVIEESEYVIIILSQNFIDRRWLEFEKDMIYGHVQEKRAIILLRDVKQEEIFEKMPELREFNGIDTKKYNIKEIVNRIKKQLYPHHHDHQEEEVKKKQKINTLPFLKIMKQEMKRKKNKNHQSNNNENNNNNHQEKEKEKTREKLFLL